MWTSPVALSEALSNGYLPLVYSYAGDNPIASADPNGLANPFGMSCGQLAQKISNLEQSIGRRQGQLDENPQNLPQSCPGDNQNPSLSKKGHVKLINRDKMLLAMYQGVYDAMCGGGGPPLQPLSNPSPSDRPNAATTVGAAGLLGLAALLALGLLAL